MNGAEIPTQNLPTNRTPTRKRKTLADKDYLVRYRAAQRLLGTGDKAAVPALTALLEEAPAEVASQAEEILCMLAGADSPAGRLGSEPPAERRRRCRAAWTEWWEERETKVDRKTHLETEQAFGLILGVEYNTGRVHSGSN